MDYTIFVPVLISFALSVIMGPVVIPVLRRLKMDQTEREEGVKSHLKKAGTPTMGGVIILTAVVITSVIYIGRYPNIIPILFVTLGFGLIGFLDDYLKVVLKRSDGLFPKQKMALQILVTAVFAFYLVRFTGKRKINECEHGASFFEGPMLLYRIVDGNSLNFFPACGIRDAFHKRIAFRRQRGQDIIESLRVGCGKKGRLRGYLALSGGRGRHGKSCDKSGLVPALDFRLFFRLYDLKRLFRLRQPCIRGQGSQFFHISRWGEVSVTRQPVFCSARFYPVFAHNLTVIDNVVPRSHLALA